MGYRRTELLVKRFPSGISSTTHLPPHYLVCSQYEILVLFEFGDCDTASKGGEGTIIWQDKRLFCKYQWKVKEEIMAVTLECPICDAEIPLEKDDRSGDVVQCSYCKEPLKLLRTTDKWILVEEFEE